MPVQQHHLIVVGWGRLSPSPDGGIQRRAHGTRTGTILVAKKRRAVGEGWISHLGKGSFYTNFSVTAFLINYHLPVNLSLDFLVGIVLFVLCLRRVVYYCIATGDAFVRKKSWLALKQT